MKGDFTKSLAEQHQKSGIRCNVIRPEGKLSRCRRCPELMTIVSVGQGGDDQSSAKDYQNAKEHMSEIIKGEKYEASLARAVISLSEAGLPTTNQRSRSFTKLVICSCFLPAIWERKWKAVGYIWMARAESFSFGVKYLSSVCSYCRDISRFCSLSPSLRDCHLDSARLTVALAQSSRPLIVRAFVH